jgi:hypothetical protein
MASQRASSMRLVLFDNLAGLKGRSTQLHQLLLGGVVGGLQRLGPIGRVPQRGAQAWTSRAKEIKRGTDPRREDQQNKKRSGNLPSTCFLSPSRAWRPLPTACCKLVTVALCSSRVRTWSVFEMLRAISSPSSFETSASRSSSDACALSRAARSHSSADRASTRAARSCWSRPSAS